LALLVLAGDRDPSPLAEAIARADPEIPVEVWPRVGSPDAIRFACAWAQPPGALRGYPNLAVVASWGAGVDHFLLDPGFPSGVTVTRFVDESLSAQMTAYLDRAVGDQLGNHPPGRAHIGFLGLGVLGRHAAAHFAGLGHRVSGWRRRPVDVAGVATFNGDRGLHDLVARVDVLINLLPLTRETENILRADLFARAKPGCYLINVARGGHLVDEDLIPAIEEGRLAGACLDVFRTEPLPADHVFRNHQAIRVTDHIASRTDLDALARHLVSDYRALERGLPVGNPVDLGRGY